MIEFQFTNYEDAHKAMSGLEGDVKERAVRAGLREVAKPVAEKQKELAPVSSGAIKKSINITVLSNRHRQRLGGTLVGQTIQPTDTAVIVGPNKRVDGESHGFKGTFLEFGVREHAIPGNVFKFPDGGFARGQIQHPGHGANPFLSSALAKVNPKVESSFVRGVERYLRRRGLLSQAA